MQHYNVHEAKTQLSAILERVEAGEEIVIARAGRPIARIVPLREHRQPRVLGLYARQPFSIAADFDELPDDIQAAFDGEARWRLLLDTHVLLWSLLEPERLDPRAADALRDPANILLASAASAWEIAIKQSLGKLTIPGPADTWLPEACLRTGVDWLPVSPVDALAVGRLPWHHRDPFDRLLLAQVRGGLVLVTHDRAMAPYGVPVLWA